MPVEEISLSSDDAEFVEEHDLDLDVLLADAIERERQQYQYENPDPEVPDRVTDKIEAIHNRATDNSQTTGIGSFQEGLIDARVAISTTLVDDGYRIRITVSEVGSLPDTEISVTLSESGAFLNDIASTLQDCLVTLNGGDSSDYTFTLANHDTPDAEWATEKAEFSTFIAV